LSRTAEAFKLRINPSVNPDAPAASLDEVWITVVEPAEEWDLHRVWKRRLSGRLPGAMMLDQLLFSHGKSAYEWGASFSTEVIIITIATGMVSAAAWDGVKAAFKRPTVPG